MTPLSINIIGSGSIGHLWTAYLLTRKVNVCLYAKQSKPSQKYQLQSPNRQFNYAIGTKSLTEWQTPQFIIICVKSTALEVLCHQLKKVTTAHPPIVLMMNGMGIIEIAEKQLPDTEIYQASTTHGAKLERDSLLHTGLGETLIGKLQQAEKSGTNRHQVATLIEVLHSALPTTKWNDQHQQALWTKLFINAIINPLTAIHNVANGAIIDDFELNLQAKRLTQQLSPLIEKYLPTETWHSIFEKVGTIANQTYNNTSSMRQDVLSGRTTEVDFITGYILNKAKIHNIALPDHEQIASQIKALQGE